MEQEEKEVAEVQKLDLNVIGRAENPNLPKFTRLAACRTFEFFGDVPIGEPCRHQWFSKSCVSRIEQDGASRRAAWCCQTTVRQLRGFTPPLSAWIG